jgi:ABC-type transporter Mla MlaB component
MLRIEVIKHERNTVRATGRLAGPWVDELAQAISRLEPSPDVELDLTEVSFIDAEGIALLRALQNERVVNLRCSAFVAAQLA